MFSELAVSTGNARSGQSADGESYKSTLASSCGYDAHYHPQLHAYGPPLDVKTDSNNFKRTQAIATFDPNGCKLEVFNATLQSAGSDYTLNINKFTYNSGGGYSVDLTDLKRQWPRAGTVRYNTNSFASFDTRVEGGTLEFTFYDANDAEMTSDFLSTGSVELMVARVRATQPRMRAAQPKGRNRKPTRLQKVAIDTQPFTRMTVVIGSITATYTGQTATEPKTTYSTSQFTGASSFPAQGAVILNDTEYDYTKISNPGSFSNIEFTQPVVINKGDTLTLVQNMTTWTKDKLTNLDMLPAEGKVTRKRNGIEDATKLPYTKDSATGNLVFLSDTTPPVATAQTLREGDILTVANPITENVFTVGEVLTDARYEVGPSEDVVYTCPYTNFMYKGTYDGTRLRLPDVDYVKADNTSLDINGGKLDRNIFALSTYYYKKVHELQAGHKHTVYDYYIKGDTFSWLNDGNPYSHPQSFSVDPRQIQPYDRSVNKLTFDVSAKGLSGSIDDVVLNPCVMRTEEENYPIDGPADVAVPTYAVSVPTKDEEAYGPGSEDASYDRTDRTCSKGWTWDSLPVHNADVNETLAIPEFAVKMKHLLNIVDETGILGYGTWSGSEVPRVFELENDVHPLQRDGIRMNHIHGARSGVARSGIMRLGDEMIYYGSDEINSKDIRTMTRVRRGLFGTTPTNHEAGTKAVLINTGIVSPLYWHAERERKLAALLGGKKESFEKFEDGRVDMNGEYRVDETNNRTKFCERILGTNASIPWSMKRFRTPEKPESMFHYNTFNNVVSVKWDISSFIAGMIAVSAGAVIVMGAIMILIVKTTVATGGAMLVVWLAAAVIFAAVAAALIKHANDNPVWLFKMDARDFFKGDPTNDSKWKLDLRKNISYIQKGELDVMMPRPLRDCRVSDTEYVISRPPPSAPSARWGWDGDNFTQWDFSTYMIGKSKVLNRVYRDQILNFEKTFKRVVPATGEINGTQIAMMSKAMGDVQLNYNASVNTTQNFSKN